MENIFELLRSLGVSASSIEFIKEAEGYKNPDGNIQYTIPTIGAQYAEGEDSTTVAEKQKKEEAKKKRQERALRKKKAKKAEEEILKANLKLF